MITLLSLSTLGLGRNSSPLEIKQAYESSRNELYSKLSTTPKALHEQIWMRLSICSEAYAILYSTFVFEIQNIENMKAQSEDHDDVGPISYSNTPLCFRVLFTCLPFIFTRFPYKQSYICCYVYLIVYM